MDNEHDAVLYVPLVKELDQAVHGQASLVPCHLSSVCTRWMATFAQPRKCPDSDTIQHSTLCKVRTVLDATTVG